MSVTIPKQYENHMDIRQTQVAIKAVKDFFERAIAGTLNLTRVSAPLFVLPETGLNDNLNGIERPVSFGIKEQGDRKAEIVQSLAKWKRFALNKYGFRDGEGLYADMTAIRRDEDTDNLHSLYVDQWDWERIIKHEDRNMDTLRSMVKNVYAALKETEDFLSDEYDFLKSVLPNEITFIDSQEMEDQYPKLNPKEREYEYAKKYGAIFVTRIGGELKSGEKHDGRAPDYDDWDLNGDIIVYYEVLDCALELSSMGIRVDAESLERQLKISGCEDRKNMDFQRMVLNNELPFTVGGGIGQSRICLYFLRKAHIGEVQSSVWNEEDVKALNEAGIYLL